MWAALDESAGNDFVVTVVFVLVVLAVVLGLAGVVVALVRRK